MPATHRPPSPVAISRLWLHNFRNYAELKLTLEPDPARPVVLVGPNGAGKTNILEAISMLGPGRGLRQAILAEMTSRNGDGPWSVSVKLRTQAQDDIDLGTGLRLLDDGSSRREARIDRESASGPAALAERIGLIWLTPAMDRLFVEGSSGRRRFLDRFAGLLVPGHRDHLTAYDQAMRDRNKLLGEHGYLGADPSWLTALEKRMAEHGCAIAANRLEATGLLQKVGDSEAVDGFPIADIDLSDADWAASPDHFMAQLKKSRAVDARMGRTECGAHRMDMHVVYRQKGMPAAQCSTGEQKALLFSLVLAQAQVAAQRRGQAPLVLLDEVAAQIGRAHV